MKPRIPRYEKDFYSKLKIKFPGSENIVKNYSQSWQDVFILTALNGKKNGTYLEIGAQDCAVKNNTYLLEKSFDWTGVSIEIENRHKLRWNTYRKNPLVIQDALTIDYTKLLSQNNLPEIIDYLQLDIEPANNTFKALMLIPFDKYKFNVITYETDLYAGGDGPKLQTESREYLTSLGYTLVVGNVCNTPGKPFEDWWVRTEILKDLKIIEDFNQPAGYYFL